MLDGERLQNRGLSLLRKRRDKGELIKGVRPALSSQLGGLRALGWAGFPANAFFGQIRPPELFKRPNWLPVLLQWLGHFPPQKSYYQPPHALWVISGKTCSWGRTWILSPNPPPFVTAINNVHTGLFACRVQRWELTAAIALHKEVCDSLPQALSVELACGQVALRPGSSVVPEYLLASLPCPLGPNL